MWVEAAAQQKDTEKAEKQTPLQMPGPLELSFLKENFVGLGGTGM